PEHDRGFNVALRPMTVTVASGDVDRNLTFDGAGIGGGVGIGAYPWRHVGFYAAYDGAALHAIELASPHSRYALSLGHMTASLELAFDSRRAGPYVAPGIAFASI